jgi:hypothetical protein
LEFGIFPLGHRIFPLGFENTRPRPHPSRPVCPAIAPHPLRAAGKRKHATTTATDTTDDDSAATTIAATATNAAVADTNAAVADTNAAAAGVTAAADADDNTAIPRDPFRLRRRIRAA